jgi:hypothetical protein
MLHSLVQVLHLPCHEHFAHLLLFGKAFFNIYSLDVFALERQDLF